MAAKPASPEQAPTKGAFAPTPQRLFATTAFVLACLPAAGPAQASEGCTVLLCLAAPSWRAIAQCVPPVRHVFSELARGKPFPVCSMSGPGNQSSHLYTYAPGYCPAQYTREVPGPNGPRYYCDYTGAIAITVNGTLFTRTWWRWNGDAVTEFSPAAKAALGTWDPRFDDELAAWLGLPVLPLTAAR